jgi:hypothetical protein
METDVGAWRARGTRLTGVEQLLLAEERVILA